MKNIRSYFFISLSFVLLCTKLLAFNGDSTKVVKNAEIPKHYFSKTVFLDYYAPGKRQLDTVNTVSKRLNSYMVSQFAMGFNFPVYTKDKYNKDSTIVANTHLLITGGYSSLSLNFGGISRHTFSKAGIGFRGIYNNGKKSIFFGEISPYVTQDRGYAYTKTYLVTATFLYNYAVSEKFALRIGFTRSYIWGNRYHLPYIGIRIGRLDKVNYSLQFPRGMTLNIPVGKYVRTSLYTKPQGGFYTFGNSNDSIQLGNIYENKKLYFGRLEFLTGLRIDILPTKHFNFYLASGFTTRNFIAFYPSPDPKKSLSSFIDYYKKKINGSAYINFGLVFRFGKTRSVYNNSQMYDAMDMNNGIDPNDNNVNPGNGDIPSPSKKMGKNKAEDVIDLIDTEDIY